jgi:hypothetical protein
MSPRYIVAALLLLFAWKGSVLDIKWPQPPAVVINGPTPPKDVLVWAEGLKPVVAKMLPADRMYLSNLYDAMGFVIDRDGARDEPIILTNDHFASFHAGTLALAIDKGAVGKYPDLDARIDEVFFSALGAEIRTLSSQDRERLKAACSALSWTFGIHRDE